MAIMFLLMELSCGRVNKIEGEYHYLYNRGTGINDYIVDLERQTAVGELIRKRKK